MTTVEEYERRLHCADECERIYAAEDAGDANDAAGVRPLLERLPVEPSRAVRGAIFRALQVIESEAVPEAAIELLSHPDAYLRNESVELLRRKGPGVIPALNRAFPRCGSSERKLILDAMASLEAPEAASIYTQALADEDINVVITAVENIGQARRTEFRETIERLFDPGQVMLAAACLEALAEMGGRDSVPVIQGRFGSGAPVAPVLLPLYAKVLGALGGEDAAEGLVALLAAASGNLRSKILEALDLWHRRHPDRPLPAALNTLKAGQTLDFQSRAYGTGDHQGKSREEEGV